MTSLPDEDIINKDAPQETPQETPQEIKEEIKTSSKKNGMLGLLMHCLTFLAGVLAAVLWLKFVFFRRFEVEWGMDYFRDPKILAVTAVFFFLMGMGVVCGLRNIITWVKECRTY